MKTDTPPTSDAIAQAADRLISQWNFHRADALRIAALILYPFAGAEPCGLCDGGVKRSHHGASWCEACNRTGYKPVKVQPLSARQIAAQHGEGDVWRNAVLDHLAVTAMDSPLGEQPSKTIGRIIDWHVAVATDPRVNGGFVLVPQAEVSDGERLDWLALHPRGAQIVINGETKDCIFWGLSSDPEYTLREAIDAARAEAGGNDGR